MTGAYQQGMLDAFASFGIRTASLMRATMPMGDMNLGAERFTQALYSDNESWLPANERPRSKNDVLGMAKAEPAWSTAAPVEAGSYSSGFQSGVSPMGGV